MRILFASIFVLYTFCFHLSTTNKIKEFFYRKNAKTFFHYFLELQEVTKLQVTDIASLNSPMQMPKWSVLRIKSEGTLRLLKQKFMQLIQEVNCYHLQLDCLQTDSPFFLKNQKILKLNPWILSLKMLWNLGQQKLVESYDLQKPVYRN